MLLEQLMQNPIAWLILSICTILSLLFCVIGKTKKEISFAKSSYSIVKNGANKISKLELYFNKAQIEDVTITKFAIWNSGNTTIKKDDIVRKEPLRVISKGSANILEVSILVENDTSNEFDVNLVNQKTAEIYFDYVDKGNGITMQVIHDGKSSDLCIEGKIKGGNKIKNYKKDKNYVSKKNQQKFKKMVSIILLVEMLICFFLLMYAIDIFKSIFNVYSVLFIIFDVIIGIMILLQFNQVKNTFKIGIPSELRVYDEYNDVEEK